MNTKSIRNTLFCLLIFVCAQTAETQSVGSGVIAGRVTDEQGGVLPGAMITVRNIDTNVARDLTANADGGYRADLLQPGNYEVVVRAPGLGTAKRSPVRVEVGSTSAADIQMKVAQITEEVSVTAEVPITDPEKVAVTSTIDQKQIQELPINARRWDNFVLLTPGVSADGSFGAISYRGISGLMNNNMVDGADNNNVFWGEARGRTRVTTGTYSQAGIQEFQVGLSNYSAEFGRAAGGTVNAVTKSGTNSVHGEVFYFIRDDSLQAREPTLFDNSGNGLKNKDRRQQFGAALGAPVVKDKLFFFADFEELHRTQTYLVRTTSDFLTTFAPKCVGGSTDAQLIKNCDALFNFESSQSGQQPRKPINNVAFGKTDWVINPNHTFTGSYNWQRWQSSNGLFTGQIISNGLSNNAKDIVKTDTAIGRLNSVLRSSVVNQLQFQFSRDLQAALANSQDPQTSVTNGVTFGENTGLPRPAHPNEKRFQWSDTLSWARGRHGFKAGLDINYVREGDVSLGTAAGSYSYSGTATATLNPAAQALAQDCPIPTRPACVPITINTNPIGKHWTTYSQAFDVRGVTPAGASFFTTTDWNFFLQDTFKWRPNVTINAGLRYELQHMPGVEPVSFNGTPVLGYPQFPESQKLNQDTNNLGPRLAVAWDIGGKQKSIVRAGGGVYFGRTTNATLRSVLVENGVGLPFFSLSSSNANQQAAGPVYPAVLTSSQALTSGTRNVSFLAGDYVRPFISMAELAYEREVARNISVSVTGVYTRSNHLSHNADINLSAPTTTADVFLADGTPLGTMPFYAGLRPLLDTLPGIAAGTRLGSVIRVTSDINSTYSGLILQLTQRARFGLTQTFHVTFANAKDEGQAQGASPFVSSFETFFDPRNRRAEYGPSELDMRRRLVWSYIWEPSSIWKTDNKAIDAIVGNWSISGITTLQDGQPWGPTVTSSLAGGATTTTSSGCPAFNAASPTASTCATATSTLNGSGGSLRAGWLPRDFSRTTGFANFDMSLQKQWRLTESKKINFRIEAFNIFNRVNHANRFNFVGSGFTITGSRTCAAGPASPNCALGDSSNLSLPRAVTIGLANAYTSVLNPVTGAGDVSQCTTSTCLSSASGTLFGPRDVQFALKFVF
jgi:hypothetical protein